MVLQPQAAEPLIASAMHATVLAHNSFEECAAYLLANQLSSHGVCGQILKPMDLHRIFLNVSEAVTRTCAHACDDGEASDAAH